MPDETNETTADPKESKPKAPTYTKERLIEDARGFFSQPSHVVAGALNGAPKNKKNFTLAEASSLIDKFLGKKAGS